MQDVVQELISPLNLLFYFFAYGLSATPTSYLAMRHFHGIDIKRPASDIYTATYIFKSLSRRSGLLVLVLDLLKGLIPCAIAVSLDISVEGIALIGFFAVLGHCFSFWTYFSGGHGGVTLAGALLMVYWPAALVILFANIGLFVAGVGVGRASVVGSLLGAIVLFLAVSNKVVWLIVAASAALIMIRHRA